MSDTRPFVIYVLSDPRNPNVPKYIGKTRRPLKARLCCHRWRSNRDPCYKHHPLSKWIRLLAKESVVPKITYIESIQDELESKCRETGWIRFLRPLNTLTNRSDGEGNLGLKVKRSALNVAVTGLKLYDSTVRRRKPVISVENGKEYCSVNEAARQHKVTKAAILNALRHRTDRSCGFTWIYKVQN